VITNSKAWEGKEQGVRKEQGIGRESSVDTHPDELGKTERRHK